MAKLPMKVAATRRGHASFEAFSFNAYIDGVSVNYSITRKPDGSIEEIGLPPGMHSRPTALELMEWAQAEADRRRKPRR